MTSFLSNSISSNSHEHVGADLTAWRLSILDRILWFGVILGFPSFVLNITNPTPHISFANYLYFALIICALFKNLGFYVRTAIFLGVLYAIAFMSMSGIGLVSAARLYLMTFICMTSLLLGFRIGLLALGLSLSTIGIIGSLILNGRIAVPDAFSGINGNTTNWISYALTFFVTTGILLFSANYLFKSLGRLASELKINIKEIEQERREKEALENQLFASQKLEAVGQLASGIAHDFNNLLVAIMGYTELIKVDPETPEKFHEYLDEITTTSDRAAALTKQLLAFGRKQTLDIDIIRPNDVITTLKSMLTQLISSQIDLQLNLDENVHSIEGDFGQLEQVLTNLIINSSDAIESGGTIAVSTANVTLQGHRDDLPAGDYVEIRIKDDGKGIDQEIIDKIFEPFFSTKNEKGNGLGLAVVYGIIKQHKGHITVESQIGQGTQFKILLPSTRENVAISIS